MTLSTQTSLTFSIAVQTEWFLFFSITSMCSTAHAIIFWYQGQSKLDTSNHPFQSDYLVLFFSFHQKGNYSKKIFFFYFWNFITCNKDKKFSKNFHFLKIIPLDIWKFDTFFYSITSFKTLIQVATTIQFCNLLYIVKLNLFDLIVSRKIFFSIRS